MGERDGYTPGTFCWVELSTTDQAAAKEFYAALFGWVADDRPVGEGSYYSMQQLDGRQVAAISGQPQQQREAGVPALWHSYVWVSDADEAADRARELGGTVHAGPFDVMQAGRMAVLQDPQGAYFMLWEPREHRGAELVNAPGAFAWNELSTPDMDAAQSFYGGLFGWSFEPYEGSPQPYLGIKNGGANNGGVRELSEPMPPNWTVYFAVDDLDASLSRVAELGGGQMLAPMDIGMARIAVVHDPQGAAFALYCGTLEP
jgi:predicted enzyme related to lactoylglutathione lyase